MSGRLMTDRRAVGNGANNPYLIVGHAVGVANAGGTGTVSTTVTFPGGLPSAYQALVSPSQDCRWWITNKTATGFTVNMTNGATLSGGSFDVLVVSA